MRTDRVQTRSGFTLPEAVMALVILGMAAAGVLLPFSSGAAAQAEGIHRTVGARLAGDLMNQIVATPFDQIVSRWNGYAEVQGQVKDHAGVVFSDPLYAGFRRDVTCVANIFVYPQTGLSSDSGFTLVFVQVYDRGRLMATLARLIGR
jgi:prepilin-type N-terminal cleavage/methylation domain-containing protein